MATNLTVCRAIKRQADSSWDWMIEAPGGFVFALVADGVTVKEGDRILARFVPGDANAEYYFVIESIANDVSNCDLESAQSRLDRQLIYERNSCP